MARAKNKRIYSKDLEYLKNLQKEYQEYGDWDTDLTGECLTIFALHRRYQRRKEKKAREKKERSKRKEKFERRANGN